MSLYQKLNFRFWVKDPHLDQVFHRVSLIQWTMIEMTLYASGRKCSFTIRTFSWAFLLLVVFEIKSGLWVFILLTIIYNKISSSRTGAKNFFAIREGSVLCTIWRKSLITKFGVIFRKMFKFVLRFFNKYPPNQNNCFTGKDGSEYQLMSLQCLWREVPG